MTVVQVRKPWVGESKGRGWVGGDSSPRLSSSALSFPLQGAVEAWLGLSQHCPGGFLHVKGQQREGRKDGGMCLLGLQLYSLPVRLSPVSASRER